MTIWNLWTQPTNLVSNGTMGGSHFAVAASSCVWTDAEQPWGAFNGTHWHGDSSLPQWLAWYNPEPLRIEEVLIQNRATGSDTKNVCAPTKYKLQASNDYEHWIDLTGIIINSNINGSAWHNPIRPHSKETYNYFRLYITAHNSQSSYTNIQNIRIKAYTAEEEIKDGTYWLGWQQPLMKSNTDYGEITATSFLQGCEPYRAVDERRTIGWATNGLSQGTWTWNFPTKLKLKRIIFRNRKSETNDRDELMQQCQFYINGLTHRLGPVFYVDKSKEQVTIECDDEIVDSLSFHKLGGRFSGIGELVIEAKEYKKVGEVVRMSYLSGAYTNGYPISQIYLEGKLIWDKSQLYVPPEYNGISLAYPYENIPETLLNGSQFVIDAEDVALISNIAGSQSASAYSYLKVTPTKDSALDITVSNGSESNYDFGGVYIGTELFYPTQEQAKNGITDGNGYYLVNVSGNCEKSTFTANLEADKTYCITLFYVKDGSNDHSSDCFRMHSLDIYKI